MKSKISGALAHSIVFACLLLPGPVQAQAQAPSQDSVVAALRERALADPTGYEFVEEMTTLFGARPAGSASEQAAAKWGAEKMRQMGFANVAVESFPLEGWDPGTNSASIIGPNPQQLVVTPLGGMTGDKVEALAAIFPTYADFEASDAAAVRGKIVVILEGIPRTKDGSGYSRAIAIRLRGPNEAAERGAVGYMMRALGTQQDRTANGGATLPQKNPFPAFALSPPDAEQLGRLSKTGPIQLRLGSTAGWKGTAQSQNVVADIQGRDPKAPPVLISAHLDSWEQGTGAVDNGFGIAVVTAAAKLIQELPNKPRRSIRIVWFGSEEVSQPAPINNFAGARAYAAKHSAEISSLALVAESDGGAGRVLELALPGSETGDLVPRLRAALLPLGVEVSPVAPRMGGPDIGVLQQAGGIPAFRLMQDASTQYDTHHNANDVLSEIDPAALSQNVAAWAVSLWLIADSDAAFRPSP